tara:strand:+ start:109 stop:474 length:366 start_codon:yes stop_codon:yes gene_type:complete
MDVLTQLLSLSNIVLCLAIVALVWAQRKGIEVFVARLLKKDLKKSKLWTEFFMPVGPLGTGALLTLIPQLPIPEMFNGGVGVRMVFGLGLGLISGLVFRMVKQNLLKKMGKPDEETPYVEE